jgi:hypothetical protein
LRAVCAGDARALGACGDDELWSARLEHELSQRHAGAAIECWSAFVNGATLQQQLGTFERLRPLAADLFVAAVEGDDDFLTTLLAARGEPAEAAAPGLPPALSTAAHFKLRPRDVPAAVRQALDVLLELDRRCKASASSLLVLYVPSALDVEASDLGPEWRDAIQRLELETADLRVTDRMATQLVGELAARGVAVLDLRRALREDPRPCYWRSRAGLNVAGHEVVARHALPDFERAALAHMR